MWRGALSGPNSIYMHSDRPLISGNHTSALVHELVHIVTGIRDEEGYDWIPEGLAEFYAVELLRRSGGMTNGRYGKVRDFMQEWSKDVETLRAKDSTGRARLAPYCFSRSSTPRYARAPTRIRTWTTSSAC